MTYSLLTPCYGCKKENECSDGSALYGAVVGIHNAGFQRGHKGSGSIELKCSNKEQVTENKE